MPPETEEYWSEIMASYMPEDLGDWFLENGRDHRLVYLTGQQVIDLGAKECEE